MPEIREAREVQITLRDFFMVIFRRKWIILSMVAVTSTVVFSALMLAPVVYISSAKILVWGAQGGGPFDRTRIVLAWDEILSSESELITSTPILERAQAALDKEAGAGRPKLVLESGRLKASPVQKSRILIISYAAPTPEEAQRVCTAVADAYVEYHKTLFAPPDLGGFFQAEIDRTREKLTDVLNKRLEIKETTDVVDVHSELESLFTVLTSHKIELVEVERKIAAIRAELGDAEAALKNHQVYVPFKLSTPSAEGDNIRYLSQELARRRVEREKLLTLYTERHPEVQRVDNELAQLEEGLARQVADIAALKRNELDALESERDVLRQRIAGTEERLRVLPVAERDIAEAEKTMESLEKQYYNLYYMRAQAAASGSSIADYHVALLSPPGYGVPTNPRDVVRMSLGPVLSLLVGIGLAFFFDNLDHSLKNPEEVERYLGLPVLTSVRRRKPRDLAVS